VRVALDDAAAALTCTGDGFNAGASAVIDNLPRLQLDPSLAFAFLSASQALISSSGMYKKGIFHLQRNE
jgi:hypothetical protein